MERRGRGSSNRRNPPAPNQQQQQMTAQQRAQNDTQQRNTRRAQTETALVTKDQTAPFFSLIENPRVSKMIGELATGTLLQPERLIFIARAGLSRSPSLLECTPISWVGALMDCAQLGLEPIGVLGHFYFVPYRNKHVIDEATGRPAMEVQGQIGYTGIAELARRSGEIGPITFDAVFRGDTIEVQQGAGTMPDGSEVSSYFRHIPNLNARTNEIIGAWCKVEWKDPRMTIFKVIDSAEISKHRGMSQSRNSDSSPWNRWEPQMSAKTAVRCIRTSLPQSTRPVTLSKALAVDEAIDLGLTPGSRWRDLGDKGQLIDSFLSDSKALQQGPQVQVTAKIEASAAPDGPPPADEPPPDMADRIATQKVEEPTTQPTVDQPPGAPSRTTEEIVAAMAGYGVTREDLEKAAAGEGEPPLKMEDWDDQCLVFFDGVLDQVKGAGDEGEMRSILYQNLGLEPGSLG